MSQWFENTCFDSIDNYYFGFVSCIRDLQNRYIPHKSSAKHKRDKPWFTNSLKNLIGRKRAVFKRLKSDPNLLEDFRLIQREVKRKIYAVKCGYEDRLADLTKDNPKAFYQYYRAKNKEPLHLLKEDDNLIHDNSQKAKILNDHFASVFNPADETEVDLSIVDDLREGLREIIISEEDVLRVVKKLKPNTAAGVDNIYARTIKETQTEIIPILNLIFNKIIGENFVPTSWKSADVIPICI